MQLADALDQLDGLMELVNALLQQNQPESLEAAVRQLRDGMQAFAGLAQRYGPDDFTPENVLRMQRMSEHLNQLRGHMAKVLAITGQQLATLLPEQANTNTYGGSGKQLGGAASVARMYHVSG